MPYLLEDVSPASVAAYQQQLVRRKIIGIHGSFTPDRRQVESWNQSLGGPLSTCAVTVIRLDPESTWRSTAGKPQKADMSSMLREKVSSHRATALVTGLG